ncbi:MAG: hypothetical protein QHD01_31585 [Bradyrhizobium sp.]|uniref:hypothetical protein n=1 Tax=Bradyrhizobium sp. TaxID=376 RepID=UPI0029B47E64|nr:hypothetical protein [Bradyrhizobium sp.]MDX3971112.1 hypothetical protein [Bradyrhizobium sp.]
MPSAAAVVVQRETTGWTASWGDLFARDPEVWRSYQRDVWHCCPRRVWTPRYSGHELFAGELRLSTHAPIEGRDDSWCWYASVECEFGDGGSIASRRGYASEAEAQAAAIAFVKSFCMTTLDALPAEAV